MYKGGEINNVVSRLAHLFQRAETLGDFSVVQRRLDRVQTVLQEVKIGDRQPLLSLLNGIAEHRISPGEAQETLGRLIDCVTVPAERFAATASIYPLTRRRRENLSYVGAFSDFWQRTFNGSLAATAEMEDGFLGSYLYVTLPFPCPDGFVFVPTTPYETDMMQEAREHRERMNAFDIFEFIEVFSMELGVRREKPPMKALEDLGGTEWRVRERQIEARLRERGHRIDLWEEPGSSLLSRITVDRKETILGDTQISFSGDYTGPPMTEEMRFNVVSAIFGSALWTHFFDSHAFTLLKELRFSVCNNQYGCGGPPDHQGLHFYPRKTTPAGTLDLKTMCAEINMPHLMALLDSTWGTPPERRLHNFRKVPAEEDWPKEEEWRSLIERAIIVRLGVNVFGGASPSSDQLSDLMDRQAPWLIQSAAELFLDSINPSWISASY